MARRSTDGPGAGRGTRSGAPRPEPEPEDPLRTLLEALAAQMDLLAKYLEQVYEEAYLETSGGRSSLKLGLERPWRAGTEPDDAGAGSGTTIEYRLDRGRLTVELARVETTAEGPTLALHRGTVVNATDPEQRHRIQVQVPSVTGATATWAMPCLPAGATALPGVGDGVWILYEDGDPERPVWIGTLPGLPSGG